MPFFSFTKILYIRHTAFTQNYESIELIINYDIIILVVAFEQKVYGFSGKNDVVDEIKKRFIPELAEFVNKKWEEKYGLSKPFRIEFKSILTQCLLSNCYKEFYHEPLFDAILSIYEQGYFPCGWQGRFPEGKILVF